jgi:hypothetical protein
VVLAPPLHGFRLCHCLCVHMHAAVAGKAMGLSAWEDAEWHA